MLAIGKRLLGTVPSLIGVIVVTFLLSHALPGDPGGVFRRAGRQRGLDRGHPGHSSASTRACRIQFVHYVADLAHGNLGHSLTTGQPVLTDLLDRLPASLELTFFALVFAVGLAMPMGVCGGHQADVAGRSCLPRIRCRSRRRSRRSLSACCWSMSSTSCSIWRRNRSGG